MRIAFVSCVKTKADRPLPAKDLYISPWFRMASAYARENADHWFVLSAEYGLLEPDRIVPPYNWTLNGLGTKLQRSWALRVIAQMNELGLRGNGALVLAGKTYRQFLMPDLIPRFGVIEVPMAGLTMGRQLGWLSRRAALTPE